MLSITNEWRPGWRSYASALTLSALVPIAAGTASASTAPSPPSTGESVAATVRVGTGDHQIVPGFDNQGSVTECVFTDEPYSAWRWEERGSYAVAWDGDCGYWPQTYNFYSFDLSDVRPGSVSRAVLVMRRFDTLDVVSQDAKVTYRLSGVHTGARALARQTADPEQVHQDLAGGREYGTFTVPAVAEPDDLLRLRLNRRAVRAINGGAGGWFSIGGALVPPFDDDVYRLFAGSNSVGIQRLVLTVNPEA